MSLKVIPLSEGAFTIDKTKQFVPFNELKDDLQERPTGSLLVEIQPFLIIDEERNFKILIDTGLGYHLPNGTMQIHNNLKELNILPGDITHIIISHLHKDHAGGVSKEDSILGVKHIAFPNATYYVNKAEFEFAMATGKPSFTPAEFEILANYDKVVWLDDEGVIEPINFYYKKTSAHSPHHMVIWFFDNGKKYFFGGDDAPQLQQMKSRFVAKYDYDGKKCTDLRQEWWAQGQNEGWMFMFYHDIKSPLIDASTS